MFQKTKLALLFVLLLALAACAKAGLAGSAAPDRASSPSPVSDSRAAPLEDTAPPKGAAPSGASGARELSEGEMEALWARLEGVWRMDAPEGWDAFLGSSDSLYWFSRAQDGRCVLYAGVPAAEWLEIRFGCVTEQDGAYTLAVEEMWGMMYCNQYETGAGAVFSLAPEAGDGLGMSVSAPAAVGRIIVILTDQQEELVGRRWRAATEEERQLLEQEDGVRQLEQEDGGILAAGYADEPVRYRRETPEEQRARMGG